MFSTDSATYSDCLWISEAYPSSGLEVVIDRRTLVARLSPHCGRPLRRLLRRLHFYRGMY